MVAVVNSTSQLRALRKFFKNTDSLNDGAAALEWLLQPPRNSITISPDSVRDAFMYRNFFGIDDDDLPLLFNGVLPPSQCQLVIPCHFLPGYVLGVIFERMPDYETGLPPVCGMPSEEDIFHDETLGFDSVLTHFVFEYRTSRFITFARVDGSDVSFTSMELREHGLRGMSGGRVLKDGSMVAMGTALLCQYCSQRYGKMHSCECPPSMVNRMLGSPVSLRSWDQVLALGRSIGVAWNGYRPVPVEGVNPLPVDLSGPCCMFIDYHFAVDIDVMDVRASYMNHMTVETFGIVLNPSSLSQQGKSEYVTQDTSLIAGLEFEVEPAVPLDGDLLAMEARSCQGDERTAEYVGKKGRSRLRHVCGICGIEFPKSHSLNRHVAAVHEQQRANQCSDCGQSFAQLANLKRHQQNVHLGVKPFPCDLCGSSFAQRGNLQRHRLAKHNCAK